MAHDALAKPLPAPDRLTEPFWRAAAEGRLLIQGCDDCARLQFYPRPHCVHCGSAALDWIEASGRGAVHTFTVTHRNTSPGFADEVPYVFAIVELEEGVRLSANLIDVPVDDARVGLPVRVTFTAISDEIALPQFTIGG